MEKDAFAIWKEAQPRWVKGTIWDRALLEEVPPRFRKLYTVFIPLNHLLLAIFGILDEREVLSGVPVPVVQATSYTYGVVWAATVCILAALALFALARRLEMFELFTTVFLIVVTATYQVSELVLVAKGDATHVALAVGLGLFLLIPIWRVIDLFAVIHLRRLANA